MKLDIEKLKGLAEAANAEDQIVIDRWALYQELTPAALLELIAEIEQRGERNVYWIDQANAISRDRATIRAERDQLKAENEDGLAVIRTLKEQLDCYMKDAERYRILRDERFRPSRLSSNPEMAQYLNEYMICGDKMDAVVDAEIAKEVI